MALILVLRDKSKTYDPGTAEHMVQKVEAEFGEMAAAEVSAGLSRYSEEQTSLHFPSLEKKVGKGISQFLHGYLGAAPTFPKISPDEWTKIEPF